MGPIFSKDLDFMVELHSNQSTKRQLYAKKVNKYLKYIKYFVLKSLLSRVVICTVDPDCVTDISEDKCNLSSYFLLIIRSYSRNYI